MRSPGQPPASGMSIYEHIVILLRFFAFQKLPISATVQAEHYIRVDVSDSSLEYGAPLRGLYKGEFQHCISAGSVPGAIAIDRSSDFQEGRKKLGTIMSWACFPNKRILIADGGVDASDGYDDATLVGIDVAVRR